MLTGLRALLAPVVLTLSLYAPRPGAFAVSCAIYRGIGADLEGLLISLLLPQWQVDVPTFVHALQVPRRQPARA